MKIKLVNQIFDTGDEYWAKYSCGICVLKMLMAFKKPELRDVPVKSLIDQALGSGGYIENVGWRHQALVDLAAFYGVSMDFQKEFFKTQEKKKEGIKFVNKILKSGLPMAVSVVKEFNLPSTAHLVVVESVKGFGPLVLGYRIVDPYPGERGNVYTVSKKEFLFGWPATIIYFK